jgi:hypothetical protein
MTLAPMITLVRTAVGTQAIEIEAERDRIIARRWTS